MEIKLTIDVVPSPLPRARHSSRGGFVNSYYPKEVQAKFDNYTDVILKALQNEIIYTPTELVEHSKSGVYMSLDVTFYMPVNKSLSKKKKLETFGQRHTKKPDIDNLLKMVLDRSTGILYDDDNNIAEVTARKIYSSYPRIELSIEYKPL